MLWINGQISTGTDLILDEGFFFGRGVFETIRIQDEPLFWPEHLVRLNTGLTALGICKRVDSTELLSIVRELNIHDCVLKIAVSPANLVMQTRAFPAPKEQGFRLTAAPFRRTANPLLIQHKCLNYMDNILAWEDAQKRGFDDAVFVNDNGEITETSRANLFFIRNGRLHTPQLSCGLLAGIIRHWVTANFPVTEGRYTLQDLLDADAVMITNSVIGIQPVSQIDDRLCGNSEIIREISKQYLDLVR